MRLLRPLAAMGIVATLTSISISGCGSGRSTTCFESGEASVCANNSDGSIEFSGSGLQPDSAVLLENPDIGLSVYEVDDDGTFEPGSRGVLAMIEGTPFTFTITATDANGDLIEGEIDISS